MEQFAVKEHASGSLSVHGLADTRHSQGAPLRLGEGLLGCNWEDGLTFRKDDFGTSPLTWGAISN